MSTKALHFGQALLTTGWANDVRIEIDGALISRIEIGTPARASDERHAIALPGLPNVHSHAFQRGMAGLAERRGPTTDSFWTWREEMYRFLRVLDPDDVAAIAAQAYVEMLEAGFTRVGEFHYLHHAPDGRSYTDIAEMARSIAAAASETGIALTLLPCFYAHAGFGGQPPAEGQRRFVNDLDSFIRIFDGSRAAIATLPSARLGVAPHSLRAVTPNELGSLRDLAADMPVHIHAAEQTREVDDCMAWSGKRPVQWLLETQPVGPRWCIIHATHMTEEETRGLATSEAVAGLCPVTEANLGDGIFPGSTYLDESGRFAVGTDSNVLISAAGELRQLEYAQRLRHRLRNVMTSNENASTGRLLFESALAGGAQALSVDRPGLVAGALADIVSLDTSHTALAHRRDDTLIDSWIFAAATSPIGTVWCQGEKAVVDGRHVSREAIARRFAQTLAKVAAS